jgi:hypothetical protein
MVYLPKIKKLSIITIELGNKNMMDDDLSKIKNLIPKNSNVSKLNQVISGSIHTIGIDVPEI